MSRAQGFAVWITGLPASGKSTVTRELVSHLLHAGVNAIVLESDALRTILTPEPSYANEEREQFYREMADIGALITRQGFPVIFDATAHRRTYRDRARSVIPRFIEVLVETPLSLCRERDPKGIYQAAGSSRARTVPGIQVPYEPPKAPDLTADGREDPARTASRIVARLRSSGWI